MPWKIKRDAGCPSSKPWGIVKEGESKAAYCHESEESAKAQLRALYAQENKMTDMGTSDVGALSSSLDFETDKKGFAGATSFADAEQVIQAESVTGEIERLNWVFMDLARNIMREPSIADKPAALTALVGEYTQRIQAVPQQPPKRGFLKSVANFFGVGNEEDAYELEDDTTKRQGPAMKRVNNIDFPARDFAYVPDSQKPSTWKLRLTESPGKVTVRQLGRAAAALSTGGFRGKMVQIPEEAMSSVKRRIRQEYRKLGVPEGKIPSSVKIDDAQPRQKSSFFVVKDKNNDYRWFAVYSNKYRDDDFPPEIIASVSHKMFVKSVDAGVFDMPELWLWHFDHPIGDADWLDYTDDGLALASGTFREGYEKSAEALASWPEPIAVSHGMPTQYLVRDQDDPSIIWFHVTKEISPLPAWAAANKLTGFVVLQKESGMGISNDKKDFLQQILPEGLFDELNDEIDRAGKEAQETGRESKEATPADEAVNEQQQKDEAEATTEETAEKQEAEFVTRAEVAEAFVEALQPLIKALNDISDRVGNVESSVKELEVSDAQKVANMAETTPKQSLSSLIMSQFTDSARVDKSAELASNQGPREAKNEPEEITGIEPIDRLIFGSLNGGGR